MNTAGLDMLRRITEALDTLIEGEKDDPSVGITGWSALHDLVGESKELIENSKTWWVNVYMSDRAYGGPEEGGWWFDTHELLTSTKCRSKRGAEEHAEKVKADPEYSNDGRRPISSVLSEGRYSVCVEDHEGVNEPAERPRYE